MGKFSFETSFGEVETEAAYNGYFYSVSDAIGIAVLGSFCGLKDMKQIIQWAKDERISTFLSEEFSICKVPCYSWFTQILGNIKPESFTEKFTLWILSLIGNTAVKTLSLDGKTVKSTGKRKNYDNPLHIVSAQLAEYGITIGQKAVEGKTNEIPTVRALLELLEIKGCMIVADALNCQKDTVKTIVDNGADYLLPVKGNQSTLEADIADYVADGELRKSMDTVRKTEKNRDRIETRTAYVTHDIDWLYGREKWLGLKCIGAINTNFHTGKGDSNEWHYYISSKKLSAQELLDVARKEWSVESMHYLLDMRFSEDSFRAAERRTQENLNIIRKIVLNLMRIHKLEKGDKTPFSNLMFEFLLNPHAITAFLP
jgi:predicted transposase YbfD/YdcC